MLTRYAQKNVAWIDLVAPTPQEVRELMREYGFHPAVGQELLSVSASSKVERFDDTVYAVFHFPVLRGAQVTRTTQEVDVIVGRDYLITTRYENVAPLHVFAKAFEAQAILTPHSAHVHGGHLFAAIMSNLYRALSLESDSIRARLEEIEERLFDGDEKMLVVEISQISRAIYDFRQALTPHREMLSSLEAPMTKLFGDAMGFYLKRVCAEYERLFTITDTLRDSMSELRETNNSMLNAKQNEVMKVFSVLAFVFVPSSLVLTLFQMGLPGTPFEGQLNFWALAGVVGLLSFIFFVYFRRKGWL